MYPLTYKLKHSNLTHDELEPVSAEPKMSSKPEKR